MMDTSCLAQGKALDGSSGLSLIPWSQELRPSHSQGLMEPGTGMSAWNLSWLLKIAGCRVKILGFLSKLRTVSYILCLEDQSLFGDSIKYC